MPTFMPSARPKTDGGTHAKIEVKCLCVERISWPLGVCPHARSVFGWIRSWIVSIGTHMDTPCGGQC